MLLHPLEIDTKDETPLSLERTGAMSAYVSERES